MLEAVGYDAYCLFCATGTEVDIAGALNRGNERFLALPFVRMMHKSTNGVREMTQDVLLKGYVFLFVPHGTALYRVDGNVNIYYVLGQKNGAAVLTGSDRRYAGWILSMGGLLGVSQAARVGDRVKIVGGPLLDVAGSIKEYAKRNRNCRVQIDMAGQQLSVWLPFDWVEQVDAAVGQYKEEEVYGRA